MATENQAGDAPVPASRARSFAWVTVVVFFVLLGTASALVLSGDHACRWGWCLALFPAAIVVQHALFLILFKSRFLRMGDNDESQIERVPTHLRSAYEHALHANDCYFSPTVIALRYGVPALGLAVVGGGIFYLLYCPGSPQSLSHVWKSGDGVFADVLAHVLGCKTSNGVDAGALTKVIHAARLGAAGAYVYVLLHLGQRTFRHDITTGAAMWSAVTLTLGPILAAATPSLINGLSTDLAATDVVYFVAGLAPRHLASFIGESVRRLLATQSGSVVGVPRLVSINQVRGITAAAEERLAEEGLEDVATLAMADPLKLLRNTSFDRRQVLAWIDEALLIAALPQNWQALENLGITGAVDLAWYHDLEALTREAALAELASRCSIDATVLGMVVERLFQDAQVRLVWVLYQQDFEKDDDGGDGPVPEQRNE